MDRRLTYSSYLHLDALLDLQLVIYDDAGEPLKNDKGKNAMQTVGDVDAAAAQDIVAAITLIMRAILEESGGSLNPTSHATVDAKMHYIYQEGREVYKYAVKGMAGEVRKVLGDLELGTGDIDVIIPHQANLRIIESLAHYLRVPMEQVAVNIERYGNTSAATIPVALCELLEQGRIKPGDRLLLAAFGAGLTRAAGLIRWGERATPLGESDAELPPCDKTALEILADAIEHTLKD